MDKVYDLYLLVHPAREFYIGVAEHGTANFISTDTCFYRTYLRKVEGYNEAYSIIDFFVTGPKEYSQKIIDSIEELGLNENQTVKHKEEKRV